MAEIKYLSLAGLTSLWGKIKNLVQTGDTTVKTEVMAEVSKKVDFQTLKGSISAAYVFKGSKKTKQELDGVATEGLRVGDVYNVEADGMNYAWTGTAWDALGGITDLSEYMKTADLVAITDEEINNICV